MEIFLVFQCNEFASKTSFGNSALGQEILSRLNETSLRSARYAGKSIPPGFAVPPSPIMALT
jgi:hypothetical protein